MVKMKVIYSSYDYDEIVTATIERDTLEEVIITMYDNMQLYGDGDMISKLLKVGQTIDEIIDVMMEENGDGCDWIFYMKDEVSGKVYIDEDGPEDIEDEREEEW